MSTEPAAVHFGITFRHHDAEEDARAAGLILLRAIEHSNTSANDWCTLSLQNSTYSQTSGCRAGNPDGDLFGQVVLSTGALSIARADASDAASAAGCKVVTTPTKDLTLLVFGDQDLSKMAGHQKSSKPRRVEDMIASGSMIRVIGESILRVS